MRRKHNRNFFIIIKYITLRSQQARKYSLMFYLLIGLPQRRRVCDRLLPFATGPEIMDRSLPIKFPASVTAVTRASFDMHYQPYRDKISVQCYMHISVQCVVETSEYAYQCVVEYFIFLVSWNGSRWTDAYEGKGKIIPTQKSRSTCCIRSVITVKSSTKMRRLD